DVASMCGASGTSYTTLLPAFQPPPGHMRSRSIACARSTLCLGALDGTRLSVRLRSSAITDIAVGITQLMVSGTHPQPYLVGSKRTWLSVVRNFRRHSQGAS